MVFYLEVTCTDCESVGGHMSQCGNAWLPFAVDFDEERDYIVRVYQKNNQYTNEAQDEWVFFSDDSRYLCDPIVLDPVDNFTFIWFDPQEHTSGPSSEDRLLARERALSRLKNSVRSQGPNRQPGNTVPPNSQNSGNSGTNARRENENDSDQNREKESGNAPNSAAKERGNSKRLGRPRII